MMSGHRILSAPEICLFLHILLGGLSSSLGPAGISAAFNSYFNPTTDDYDMSYNYDYDSQYYFSPPNNVRVVTVSNTSVGLCDPHFCDSSYCGEKQLCSCDPECSLYGDCCFEYSTGECAEKAPPRDDTWRSTLTPQSFSCILPTNKSTSYLYVSSCPKDTADTQTAVQCENPDQDDVFATIPCYGTNNGLHYRNIYCGLCHGEDQSDLIPWEIYVECSDQPLYAELASELLQSSIANLKRVETELGCDVLYLKPYDINNTMAYPRGCYPNVIRHCPTEEDVLTDACESYTALTETNLGGQLFRNPHCALCNLPNGPDRNESATYCLGVFPVFYLSGLIDVLIDDGGLGTGVTYPPITGGRGPPPLSIIFNFRSDSKVTILRENEILKAETVECSVNEVYDPFVSKCRKLSCAAGYIIKGGQCVLDYASMTSGPACGGGDDDIDVAVTVTFGDKCQGELPDVLAAGVQPEDVRQCLEDFTKLGQGLTLVTPSSQSTDCPGLSRLYFQAKESSQTLSGHRRILELSLPVDKSPLCSMFNVSKAWTIELEQQCENMLTENCSADWRIVGDEYALSIQNSTTFVYVNASETWYTLNQTIIRASFKRRENSFEHFTVLEICADTTLSCPLETFNSSLFQDDENKTGVLTYTPTGDRFMKDEYIRLENGYIQVCSFNEKNGTQNKTSVVNFFAFSTLQQGLSLVGNIISMVAAAVTFATYCLFKELRKRISVAIMGLVASLFMAQLLFLLSGSATINPAACTAVAFLGHFFWLSAVLWTSVLAFDLHQTFAYRSRLQRVEGGVRVIVLQLLFTVCVAMGIVLPCLVIHLCDCTDIPLWYGDENVCWIGNGYTNLIAFGLPIGVIVFVNIVLFSFTVRGIRLTKKQTKMALSTDLSDAQRTREELLIYAKISSLMGFTWIFGFAAAFSDLAALWYIFIILNSCQGLLIFLSFICNKKVWSLWRNLMRRGESRSGYGSQTPSSRAMLKSKNDSNKTSGTRTTNIKSPNQSEATDGCQRISLQWDNITRLSSTLDLSQMIRPSKSADVVPVCNPSHVCSLDKPDPDASPDSIPGCYCDDACEYFDDCCYDYEKGSRVNHSHWLLENPNPKVASISRSSFICRFLGSPRKKAFSFGYWLVSFCPGQAPEFLRHLCEHPSDSDLYLQTPVTSSVSNISYKNIFCGLCHGEDDALLGLWKIDIKCSTQFHELLKIKFQEDGVIDYKNLSTSCNVKFLPLNTTLTRICFPFAITNCTTESDMGEACASYTAITITASDPWQIYKNPHCALECGVNITVDEYTCKILLNLSPPELEESGSMLPSFSMLVDFNSFKLVTSENVVTTTYCPSHFVFDPTANRCRYVSCPSGGLMENGQCVQSFGLNDTVPMLEFRIVVKLQGEVTCNASTTLKSCLIDPLLQAMGEPLHKDSIEGDIEDKTTCWQNGGSEVSHEFTIPSEITLQTRTASIFQEAIDVLKESRQGFLRCINLAAGVVLHSVAIVKCYSPTCDVRHTDPDLCSTSWLYFTQDAPYMNDTYYGFLYANDTWFSHRQTIFDTRYFWRQTTATFERGGTHVQICDGQKLTCAFATLSASLFRPITTEHANDSLEYLPSGEKIDPNSYSILRNGSVQMCLDYDRNGTLNKTIEKAHFSLVQQIMSVVGCSLSMTLATATFVTYLIFPSLKNNIHCPLMNLTASLVLAYLMFMLSSVATRWNDILCILVAFFGHVFWLMTSTWSNIIAFTLNHAFASKGVQLPGEKITAKQLLFYYLYAWGVPCLVAVPCLFIDTMYQSTSEVNTEGLFRYRGDTFCWVEDPYQLLYSFTLPLAAPLLLNVVLFAHTVYGIRKAKMQSKMARGDASRMKQAMEELPIYLKISSLMGFAWLFAFLAKLTSSLVILYIFIILISSQGVVVFISFCCNSRVYSLWKGALRSKIQTILHFQTGRTKEGGAKFLADNKTP
ncbi:uncharacterized protein LOC117301123 [Asterias rubens]|uniref:uncharacterized protein LOC117301123 n=1 Tax=Asterias rubens TaxID=7604 RepID=UPI00145504BC|nr:uncharacterized protein LOC117301123 [Asterias rubens]